MRRRPTRPTIVQSLVLRMDHRGLESCLSTAALLQNLTISFASLTAWNWLWRKMTTEVITQQRPFACSHVPASSRRCYVDRLCFMFHISMFTVTVSLQLYSVNLWFYKVTTCIIWCAVSYVGDLSCQCFVDNLFFYIPHIYVYHDGAVYQSTLQTSLCWSQLSQCDFSCPLHTRWHGCDIKSSNLVHTLFTASETQGVSLRPRCLIKYTSSSVQSYKSVYQINCAVRYAMQEN